MLEIKKKNKKKGVYAAERRKHFWSRCYVSEEKQRKGAVEFYYTQENAPRWPDQWARCSVLVPTHQACTTWWNWYSTLAAKFLILSPWRRQQMLRLSVKNAHQVILKVYDGVAFDQLFGSLVACHSIPLYSLCSSICSWYNSSKICQQKSVEALGSWSVSYTTFIVVMQHKT